jgi:hypothetical protein
MLNCFANPVRAFLLATILAFAALAAEGRAATAQTPIATVTTGRSKNEENPSDRDAAPVGGILIVVGIVGGIILLAWVCSRISDNRPSMP